MVSDKPKPLSPVDTLPPSAGADTPATPPVRDARGRLLPGQRALNPAGRPPRSVRVRSLARSYTREAIETLVEVMRESGSAEARTRAATTLLDRGWGRPAQQLRAEVSGTPAITINLPWLAGRGLAGGGRPMERDSLPHARLIDGSAEDGESDSM